ncbi:MAG: hypothetical protein KAG82_08005 [Alcanivoracaceae bacterium]|jgi:hypothetical protein|nr:hypothetical protein [Alcanivoracaceae bacterium]
MSPTSSPGSVALTELPSSRGPLLFWGVALLLSLAAVMLADMLWQWRLVFLLFLVWVGSIEWRLLRRPQALAFSPESVQCRLRDGRVLEADWPLDGMVCPFWVTLRFPVRLQRRISVTIYRDQLCADDFRRLRVLMRA